MAKKIHYSPIGLDIASSGIKLLQLKNQKGSLSVYKASQIDLHNILDEEIVSQKLRELLANAQPKGNQVMSTLPSHLITTVPIKLTLKEDEKIDEVLIREAGSYLSFPLESAIIDYLHFPSDYQQKEKSVHLIAAKRKEILQYINILQQAGLEAVVIEPRYCSLFRTIQWVQEEGLKDQFIFYVEENNTIIMVLVDEKILIVREIPWGVKAVRTKLEQTLELSGERVDNVLQQYGVEFGQFDNQEYAQSGSPDKNELFQVIYEVINPILEELCQEIQKVLSYCASIVQQRVIDQALLLGGGAKIKSLANFIQYRTGVKVMSWDDSTKIKLLMDKNQAFFDIALGLALRDKTCLV